MIYSFLYVLVFSFGLVFIQKMDVNVSPIFSLMITATIASLYFNIINFRHLKKMYSDCLNNKKLWFFIMLLVLVMWSGAMIAPELIGASLFNFLNFACLGSLGFLSQSFQDWKNRKQKFWTGACSR